MTEYREILRLNALGLSGRSIAGSVSRSRNTVADALTRAAKLGLEWPLPLEMTDIELERMLYPEKSGGGSTARAPDFEKIHRELAQAGVTMTLLWDECCNECRGAGEIPYQYSQYCKMYRKFAAVSKATMHIARKPGEQIEVDWAGQTSFIRDNVTGKDIPAYIFVAVLPASQYAYVEAFATQNMESWITAHIHAFSHFGGVPRIIVPDNLKTGVDKPGWYTPVINRTYHEMAEHYGTAIVPARVRRPKDKASVEGTVGHISTWIIAALRHGVFFSIPELNAEIKHKLAEFNERPFQKRPGSRRSVFLEEERAMLFELPAAQYEIASWKKATVAYNYHICIDGGYYYSVPYEYIKYQVDVRITSRVVEVFYKGVRICSHPRLHGPLGQYRTIDEHMPPKHRASGEWNAERFISWGRSIGTNTEEVIRSLLSRYKVEQQGYRSCMGVLKMADKYSVERLESACARALSYTPQPSYKNIAAILKSGQDKVSVKTQATRPINEQEAHSFIRGAEYYGGGSDGE